MYQIQKRLWATVMILAITGLSFSAFAQSGNPEPVRAAKKIPASVDKGGKDKPAQSLSGKPARPAALGTSLNSTFNCVSTAADGKKKSGQCADSKGESK